MGRKGNWFSSVKKALSPDSKEKKNERSSKSKKKWFAKQNLEAGSAPIENVAAEAPLPPLPPQLDEEVKALETTIEVNKHGYTSPVAAAELPEPAAPVVVETTVEVVRKANKFAGKSKEEAAAIRIQTAFRGYLARRALRALRGLVRLKMLMGGPTVKRQAVHTLKCMQTLARVQTQIHTRRVRMSEENQALQRQLLQKHARELESLRMKEGWDDSVQSKEQVESNMLSKFEAAMRRERALAYAFSHQQTLKTPARPATGMFMTPGNPSWGWSWLERWMSAHPWDTKNTTATDKDPNNDQASVKSGNNRSLVGGEISKAYARYQLNSDKLSPGDYQMSTNSPSATSKPVSSVVRKLKSASPRSSIGGPDEDTRSMVSFQSNRRHSIAGSSVRDDESLASLPSYMVPTESAKAKSRFQSPLGLGGTERNRTTPPEKEKGALSSAKKRLAYPPSSPARPRRHSGPPKVDTSLIKAENVVVPNGDM